MKIAGLDIGTTGCKLTVFDGDGVLLDTAYRDYPVSRKSDAHEIDMEGVMDAVREVIGEIAAKYRDIAAIGITSFGETFVLTDEAGKPLYPSMLYTDPRGEEQCRTLCERMGESYGRREEDSRRETDGQAFRGEDGRRVIAGITGLKPHEMYSISKVMWIRAHEPEIWEKGRYIFQVGDYVAFHLTGKRCINYSLATRSMAFDIRKCTWSGPILEAAGVDEAMLSTLVPDGTDVGAVRADVARETGLPADCRIILAGHDQVAAAVGAGAFDGDVAVDGAGTVECLTVVYDAFPDPDVMYGGGFPVVPYVLPGYYLTYAFSYTGGALIEWFVDTLAKKEKELAQTAGCSVNAWLEDCFRKEKGAEPTGLLVLPHFAGAATPYMDIGSKGAVLGLTTATTTADLYRACMEGVVYEMLVNVDALRGSGHRFTRINATGGGARSDEWMQMKADALGLPVTAMETADAGTVGSAMLTGVAIGLFRDLDEAAGRMVKPSKTFYPREEMHRKYMEVYERYRNVYDAVRPLV